MSFVAERVRSVGVASGASRLRRSSEVFVELDLFIVWFQRLACCPSKETPRAIPCLPLPFVTYQLCEFWVRLKVRFHPPSKLKIDMLSTSIGSCIGRLRRNTCRGLRMKLRCAVLIVVSRSPKNRRPSILFLEFIRSVSSSLFPDRSHRTRA